MAVLFSDLQPDKPRLALVAGLMAALTVPAIGYLLWSAAHHDGRGESVAVVLIVTCYLFGSGLAFFIGLRGQPRKDEWLMRFRGISKIILGFVALSFVSVWGLRPAVTFPLIGVVVGMQLLFPLLAVFALIRQRRQSSSREVNGPCP
jgi:hypothetical protein